jgi:hypothetical protein
MTVSLRPAFIAGVASITACVIAFTLTVTPTAHASMTRAGSAPASHAVVDTQVEGRQLVPAGAALATSPLSTAQVLAIGRALSTASVTPTIAPYPPLVNLANAIDAAYLLIEPWVRYAVDVAAYVAAWIIPYVGWIVINQVEVVYNFVESLVHSGVFNTTDWLRGEGSVLKNVSDWIVDLGLAVVWLGIDEIGAWIPFPPLPFFPPRPPYADVPEGLFGDIAVGVSAALALVSNRIWDLWLPIRAGVDRGVGFISEALDSIAWVPFVPLIDFELNEGWKLIAAEGDAITGFAHDLINAGNQFVVDTVDGSGLIAATMTAIRTTLESISARGGEAVGAFADWGRAQLEYLVGVVTPGGASPSAPALAVSAASRVGVPDGAATGNSGGDALVASGDPTLGSSPAGNDLTGFVAGADSSDIDDERSGDPDSDVADDTTVVADRRTPASAKTPTGMTGKDSRGLKTATDEASTVPANGIQSGPVDVSTHIGSESAVKSNGGADADTTGARAGSDDSENRTSRPARSPANGSKPS